MNVPGFLTCSVILCLLTHPSYGGVGPEPLKSTSQKASLQTSNSNGSAPSPSVTSNSSASPEKNITTDPVSPDATHLPGPKPSPVDVHEAAKKNKEKEESHSSSEGTPKKPELSTTAKAPLEVSDLTGKTNETHSDVTIHPETREEGVKHSNSVHSKPEKHQAPDVFMPETSNKKTYGAPTAAAYAAVVCIVATIAVYGAIIIWKRVVEHRERSRGMLLTEDDMADLNDPDLRVFETASLQIEV